MVEERVQGTHNHPPRGHQHGGRDLPARLAERFPVRVNLDWDPVVEARLCPDPVVLAAFAALRSDPSVRTPLSTRILVSFVENRKAFGQAVALQLLAAHLRPEERDSVAETFRLAAVQGQRARR